MESMNNVYAIETKERNDRYVIPLIILLITDICVISLSFLAAYWLRFYSMIYSWFPPPPPPYVPDFSLYFKLSVVIAVLGAVVFERIGLYQRRVGLDRKVQGSALVLSVLVTYIFVMALLFNYRGVSFSRLTVAMAVPISCGNIVFVHSLLKQFQFYMIKKGIVFVKTVLVGPLSRCIEFNHKLQEHHGSQYQILGYITSEDDRMRQNPLMPCLGTVDRLSSILDKERIDNVIITMSPPDHRSVFDIMKVCSEKKISYRIIPELYDVMCQRVRVGDVTSLPTILFGESPLGGFGNLLKRAMDVIISGVGLVATSPLLALIAILIKLDTKGSVFYVQERVGQDGTKFNIIKFRSMIDNAEDNTGPVWAASNDPRTTRIGRFLRRYNLDEIPQLINVLRGDMSLVGPRPERPYFVDKFKEEIPLYMRRHIVKAGLTGWAQVNGWRGDTSVSERTEFDLYYVENWSLLFDLKILWKTLTSFKNAY